MDPRTNNILLEVKTLDYIKIVDIQYTKLVEMVNELNCRELGIPLLI